MVVPYLAVSNTGRKGANNVAVKVIPKGQKEVPLSPPLVEEIVEEEEIDLGDSSFKLPKDMELRKTPPFPSKNITPRNDHIFFDWIGELIEEDWYHILVWIYREWPYIDRQRVNPQAAKYIDKYGSKFTKDTIIKGDGEHPGHGSGKYKLIVTDARKTVGGKGGQLGIVKLDINDDEYPPMFRIDELVVEHASNRAIVDKLVAQGRLTVEGKVMTPNNNNQGGIANDPALIALLTTLIQKVTSDNNKPQSKDATLEAVMGIMTKTNDTSIAMLRDQIKGDDPEKWLKLVTLVKELIPKPENNNNMLETLLKIQADAHARESSLTAKLFDLLSAKNENGDSFDKELDRMAKLKDLIGEGNGKEAKKSTLETVLEYGGPVLLKVGDILSNLISVKNYEKGLNLKQQQRQQTGEQPTPQAPQALEEPAKDNVTEMPQSNIQQFAMILRGPAGMMIVDAMNRDQTGFDVAASVVTMFGRLQYDQIMNIGKEGMLSAMESVPEFWSKTTPVSAAKFVDEFIAFATEEEEGEE